MIQFNEVYEESVRYESATEKGATRMQTKRVYKTRNCLVNPRYIVSVYSHKFESSIEKDMLRHSLPKDAQFSRIILDGNSYRTSEIIVDISYDAVWTKLINNMDAL